MTCVNSRFIGSTVSVKPDTKVEVLKVNVVYLHLICGWCAILLSFLSGAGLGLFFHQEDWLGGYRSFRRRMLRLAHISFFGLGTINLLFGLTLNAVELDVPFLSLASSSLIIAVLSMPLCCYLSAWKRSMRLLFPIPVVASVIGVLLLLVSLLSL